MGFIRWWPLFLVAFVPGIVLLYLLKQKVEEIPYSAVNLWKEAYENIQAKDPWEKFRNQILMYLQIGALLLLILGFMMPYLKSGSKNYSNVVICIDTSASMNSLYKGDTTRLEEAKKQASSFVEGLSTNTSVTVISCGENAQIQLANGKDTRQLKRVITGIEATDEEGSLNQGISLIQSMASQWSEYQLIGYTDSNVNLEDLSGEIVDLSSAGANLSLDYVSYEVEDSGKIISLAKITNHGTSTQTREIHLYLGEDLYDIEPVTVKAGESQTVYFKEISATKYAGVIKEGCYLKGEIYEKDLLEKDNTAYAILGGNQGEKVLLVTEQNAFMEKAIAGIGGIDLEKTTSLDNIGSETYDLIIYDGMVPEEWPLEGNVMFINPPKEFKELFTIEGKEKNVLIEGVTGRKETTYLDDFSFGCSLVRKIQTPSWAESFLKFLDQYSAGFIGHKSGRTVCVLGFDFHDSELPLQTEFPILIYNLMEQCLNTGILAETNYASGQLVSLQLSEEAAQVEITNPDGETAKLDKEEQWIVTDTKESGLYQVEVKKGQKKQKAYFAVKFPVSESDTTEEIAVQSKEKKGTTVTKSHSSIGMGTMLYRPVLALLILLLLIEWCVYRRKL